MFKNVASQKIALFAFDSATNLPKTGDAANITAYVSKDHGTVTVLADTTATEQDAVNAKGMYLFDLAQSETNGDELTFSAKSATSGIVIVPRMISTLPPNMTLLAIDAGGLASSNVTKVNGTVQTAGDLAALSTNIQSRIPAALISGRIDSSVGAMATDVLTSGALATSAVTEIQTGLSILTQADIRTAVGLASANIDTQLATIASYLDTEIAAILTKVNNLPASPAATSDIPSANAIADQVWDEVLSGHLGAGSTGNALNAAGSAGDPWATTLPGAYGAGSAGKIIGDNLNATISSRSTQTSVDAVAGYVDTEIATIIANISALPSAASIATAVLTTAMAESYRANGSTGTLAQMLYEILANLVEAVHSGTTKTVKKIDHVTTAAVYNYDNATPTSITRGA